MGYYDDRDSQIKKHEYIRNDPCWQEKRKNRFKIDEYSCVLCGKSFDLQCHHISYLRLYDENIERDLVTLCSSCHDNISVSSFILKDTFEMKRYISKSKAYTKSAIESIIGNENMNEIKDYPKKELTAIFSNTMMKYEVMFGGKYNFTSSWDDLDRCLEILAKSVFENYFVREEIIGRNNIRATFVLAKRKVCEYLINDLNMKKTDVTKKYNWVTTNILNNINKNEKPNSCYENVANYISDTWIDLYNEGRIN